MKSLYTEGFAIYETIYQKLADNKKLPVFGISSPQKAHLAAATPVPLLYLAATEEEAKEASEIIENYGTKTAYLPPRGDVLLGRRTDALSYARIAALQKLSSGKAKILVTSVEGAFGFLPRKEDLARATTKLSVGETVSLSSLTKNLAYAGYERVDGSPKKGEYRLVGDALSIFPVSSDNPIKIEFLYDEVESIKIYAPDYLSVLSRENEIVIAPASEILLTEEDVPVILDRIEEARRLQNRAARIRTDEILSDLSLRAAACPSDGGLSYFLPFMRDKLATVFDYTKGFSVVLDEPKKIFETFSSLLASHYGRVRRLSEDGEVLASHFSSILSEKEIMASLSSRPELGLSSFEEKISGKDGSLTLRSSALPNYLKNTNMLTSFVREELKEGRKVLLFCEDKEKEKTLRNLLGEDAASLTYVRERLKKGFISKSERVTIIGSGDVLSKTNALRAPSRPLIPPKIGDYVVHDDFGIGRCLGLVHIKNYAGEGDYVALQYAESNKIYLPVSQMDMLTVYAGSEKEPELSNPNKEDFQKEKAKAKKSIRKMALDLVELYAKREKTKGVTYPPDSPLEEAFEKDFPFEETEGQEAAIRDVKSDMESGKVMDRLLCGDVGFGKTEVALRAAFKTVMAGKQVAFLAPTTILAEQHFSTLSERFGKYGIQCACLTRFCTPKETKEILKGVKNGSIAVVVGTHRLLSKDVEFYDVGLLVLDEEQRFGVEHKEKIKSLRTSVNVLSMSATPIPRTLHMALSGIRDISVIETPPKNRKPVRTVVAEYTPALLKEAVSAELERGGQVFILYNNVARLSSFASEVSEAFPEAAVTVGHGQMPPSLLEENVRKFYKKQADILICTTIIENGIDVPDANTLVVLEANKLGLSQMYQIKGRVGRSEKLAYAYFTYPAGTLLTGDAEKRLKALVENGDLGSGYRLAMMDLEIRGAGNVLGAEQHGHIEKVGYDMYCALLRETIAELNGEPEPDKTRVEMLVAADAYIPKEYISSELGRIRYYKKISAISDEKSKNALLAELEEEFGMPPVKVHNLAEIALAKKLAASLYARRVTINQKEFSIAFEDPEIALSAGVKNALRVVKDELAPLPSEDGEIRFVSKKQTVIGKLESLIRFMKAALGAAV